MKKIKNNWVYHDGYSEYGDYGRFLYGEPPSLYKEYPLGFTAEIYLRNYWFHDDYEVKGDYELNIRPPYRNYENHCDIADKLFSNNRNLFLFQDYKEDIRPQLNIKFKSLDDVKMFCTKTIKNHIKFIHKHNLTKFLKIKGNTE